MRKNVIFETTVTALSSDGSGIGKIDGMTVFVPFTAIGDVVKVKAVKVTKSVIYGKLLEIITPSSDRIETAENDCDVFTKCGGCNFRHISYKAEIKAKETFIRDAFTRIGKLNPEFLPFIESESVKRYRNKAQYPIGIDNIALPNGQVTAGFYSARSHRIIPCQDCKLQPKIFGKIIDFIVKYIQEKQLPVYDEITHSGVIRQVCLRQGHYSKELNVCLVVVRQIPELEGMALKIAEQFPAVKGVVLNINSSKSNVILGNEEVVLVGESDISDTMCGLKVKISPNSFYQVNTPSAEKLYRVVAEFVSEGTENNENATILDLYCGIGTIGLSLASHAKKIIGVERVESAVKNAMTNAEINSITNARFFCKDLHCDSFQLQTDLHDCGDLSIVIDPARKGCDFSTLKKIAELRPKRIVMVSCDPATAARDCSRLGEFGYKTTKVGGVDLFPRTRHVECVACLCRED